MRRRPGLRTRVTVAFAVGALALTTAFAALTYELSRTYLLRQRETSAQRQTFVNARLVRSALRAADPEVPELLASLEAPAGSHPLLHLGGRWYAASVAVGPDVLPDELRRRAVAGEPVRQRFVLDGEPHIAVAVPLPSADAVYFEVFRLELLAHTLAVLRNSLLAGGTITALAGAALGWTVSRRVLRPVRSVAGAATEVASGRLDMRMEPTGDRDLDEVTGAFNRMTESLRERIERERRFTSAVSHELRSPLTTLAAAVEVLDARRAELPDRARQALDLLAEEVRRFEQLVRDLLEISRLEAGAVELEAEDVRLGELVLHAVDSYVGLDVPVEVDDAALDATVCVDKRRVERVLANLLENAARYGDGPTRVAVERSGPGAVRLVVEDAGPGVPDDERDRIFERFARGAGAGSRGDGIGTGLGLSIVAEHVRLHGGRVWVEEGSCGGARFVVELPEVPLP